MPSETLGDLCRGAQEALAVAAPLLLTAVERGAAADRNERVLKQRAPRRVRVDVPGGDRVDAEMLGEVTQSGVPTDVAALVRSLQLDEEVLTTERACQPGSCIRMAHGKTGAGATGEADETFGVLLDEPLAHGWGKRLAILTSFAPGTRVRLGEDAAQIRVAPTRLDEQRHVRAVASSVTSAPVIGRTPRAFAA